MGPIPLTCALVVCLSALGQPPAQVETMMEAGHWKRVRQLAGERIAANPNDPLARGWLAKAKLSFGDVEGALAESERAVAANPKDAGNQAVLAESCALMAERSSAIRSIGHLRCLKRALEAGLAADPKNVDVLLVDMMFSWKAPSLAGGDKKKAMRIAGAILSISPVWGNLALARLGQETGPDRDIEGYLQNAVRADPNFYRARASLARFYCCTAKTKNFVLAERAARDAIALDPQAGAGYAILARVLVAGKRWTELESLLAKADTSVPDDRSPYYAAAETLIDSGQDFQRAQRYLEFYLAQPVEGRQPVHAEARWQLARLFEKDGRKTDAVRELLAAIRLEPGFEIAKRDLKRLRRT